MRETIIILVPRAAILLASATDQELSQGPNIGSLRITDFRLSAQPQKFETITVTIGYKNGQLLRLRVILAPARALDPWRWPKGSQVWGREWTIMLRITRLSLSTGWYKKIRITLSTVPSSVEFGLKI